MTKSNPFIIGRGSEVTVALLRAQIRSEVVPQTITLGAPAAAAATTLTVAALTEPLYATPNHPLFLSVVDAVDESDHFVKVTADAAVGATSLTVASVKRAINDASAAVYPVKLQARTSADLNTSSNDVNSTTFDTGGYADGIVSQITRTVSCPGNFLSLDAGFRTCQAAFQEFLEVWLTVKLPVPGGYTSGYIYRGPASVTNAPITVPADGIITAAFDFAFRGKIQIIEPA